MNIKAWGNGNWDSEENALENFESYFNYHYKPLLNKLVDNPKDLSDNDRHLLGFLRDDLIKIFSYKE